MIISKTGKKDVGWREDKLIVRNKMNIGNVLESLRLSKFKLNSLITFEIWSQDKSKMMQGLLKGMKVSWCGLFPGAFSMTDLLFFRKEGSLL